MHELMSTKTSYLWLMTGKAAVSWTEKALANVNARINSMNPLDDLEELAYARKTRDALQKALKEMQFITKIKP